MLGFLRGFGVFPIDVEAWGWGAGLVYMISHDSVAIVKSCGYGVRCTVKPHILQQVHG